MAAKPFWKTVRVILGAEGGEIPTSYITGKPLTTADGKHLPEPHVPFVVLFNTDTAGHTIALYPRTTPAVALTLSLPAGTGWCLPSSTFAQIVDQNANGTVLVWSSDVPLSAMTASNVIANPLPVTLSPTNVDFQFAKTVDVAAAQAEEVLQAGATNVPDGALIRYGLAMASATAADDATVAYVALKGEASGKYLVMCTLGSALAGTIRKATGQLEKIDIVAANAGAVGHSAGGSWNAETGGQ